MGGVDRFDLLVAMYRIKVKSRKWWWNHFTNTLGCCMAAAFYLWQKGNPERELDFLGFTRAVVMSYIGSPRTAPNVYPKRSANLGQFRVPASIRLNGREHWPEPGKPMRCAWPPRSKRIRTKCSVCNVALYLENNHWRKFHTSTTGQDEEDSH